MKVFQVLALAALLVAGVSAQNATFNTVYEALNSTAELSGLLQAVEALGLNSTLADPTLQALIFAPTNQALGNTLAALNISSSAITPQNATVLAETIFYHIVPSGTPFPQLPVNQSGVLPNTLLNTTNTTVGSITVIPLQQNGTVYLGGVAPGATTDLATYVTAARSTIYLLNDSAIVPPLQNVTVQYLSIAEAVVALGSQPSNNLSTLLALAAADPLVLAYLSNKDAAVTLFAPTDDAFAALLSQLNVSAASLLGTPLARAILLEHIVDSRPYLSYQLSSENQNLTTPLITTNSTGNATAGSNTTESADYLFVSGNNNTGLQIRGPGNTNNASVIQPDIKAGKSVIHVIDAVLLPAFAANSTNGTFNGTGVDTSVGPLNGTFGAGNPSTSPPTGGIITTNPPSGTGGSNNAFPSPPSLITPGGSPGSPSSAAGPLAGVPALLVMALAGAASLMALLL